MYLPDNIQNYLRSNGTLSLNEVAKKEGDLFIAVNVVDQQRRIINVDGQLIESLMKQTVNPPNKRSSGGLLKG